jgi:hypothetical protein
MMSDDIQALESLCAAADETERPAAAWRALDVVLQAKLGHKLLTVQRIDASRQWSERIYSSQPDAFGAYGRKSLDAAPQMRRVIASGRPLIIDGEEAVRGAFPDHARILAMGGACVLMLPLRWSGRTLAVINLLGETGAYADADARFAWVAARLCMPALLA